MRYAREHVSECHRVPGVTDGAASAATPFEFDSPLGIVAKLYHDYSYEAAFNQNAAYSTVLDQPEPV